MTRIRLVSGLALAIAALPGFCELVPRVRTALDSFKQNCGPRWADGRTRDGRHLVSLTGVPTDPAVTLDDMTSEARKLAGDSRIVFTTHPFVSTLGPIRQLTYPQFVGDEIVENAAMIVQYSKDGGPIDIVLNVAVPPDYPTKAVRSPAAARGLVHSIVKRELAKDLRPLLALGPAELDATSLRIQTEVLALEPHYLAFDRRLRRIFDVRVRVLATTECGPVTVILRDYAIDATTDSEDPDRAIVRFVDLIQPAVEGLARVFDPNPINTLNLAQMPEDIQFDLTMPPYIEKRLAGMSGETHPSYALAGNYVTIREVTCPESTPETKQSADAVPDFGGPRGGVQFAAANAYYHIDAMARWIKETLLMPETVPDTLSVDINTGKSQEPQAAYVRDNLRHLSFGVTERHGIYVAEDGDAVAHEYAHAVLDHMTNGYFQQKPAVKGKVEARAINEGFADYWAMSTFSKQTLDSGHALDCFMEWANEGKCLRYYPSLSYSEFKPEYYDHVNGRIWSGTLYEIFQALGKSREVSDGIILMGHLLRAKPGVAPTMAQMAEGMIIADAQRSGGQNKETLCNILQDRFGPLTCCTKVGCTENWNP